MAENSIITKVAREKMIKARAGEITLPKIVGMAFGDGGTDSDGNVLSPTENQIELRNEIYRKNIDGYVFANSTTCAYDCTLSETELAGKDISEIGLYDEENDFVGIMSCRKKGKDFGEEMTFTLEDIF